jgi:hypothetical protein
MLKVRDGLLQLGFDAMKGIRLSLVSLIAVLVVPAVAHGAVRTASATYYCTSSECAYDAGSLAPPSGPTFNPAPPPTITTFTVGFTYDPLAGILTYTEDTPEATYPFDPNYCADNTLLPDCTQVAAQWTSLGMVSMLHGINTPGTDGPGVSFGSADASVDFPTAQADWDANGNEIVDSVVDSANILLHEDGVRGLLAPVTTLNGGAITFTWSSALLRNLSLTEIKTDTAGLFLDFDLHFAGYGARPPTPKPIMVPTGYSVPQVKPYTLTVTGDGSGFFGGRTGQKVTGGPHQRANFGRLRWTQYSATDAYATGVEWGKFGPGPLSTDRFKIDGTVQLHAYRPRSGVFTRLAISGIYGGHHYHSTAQATYSDGSWYW